MKIVKEHINFERGLDPKAAMNVGVVEVAKTWNMREKYDYFYSKLIPAYGWLIGPIRNDDDRPGTYTIGLPLRNMKNSESLKYEEELEEWFKKEMPIFNFKEVRKRSKDKWHYLMFSIKPEYDTKEKEYIESLKEHINFERGLDPKKAMDVGLISDNTTMEKIKKNFVKAHPEIDFCYTGLIKSSGITWHTFNATINNIQQKHIKESFKQIDEKYLEWFQKYTKFKTIVSESFKSSFHPWGDKNEEPIEEWHFSYKLKDGNIQESYHFERGLDPKDAMKIGAKIRKGNQFIVKKYSITDPDKDYVVTAEEDERKNVTVGDCVYKRFISIETPKGGQWFASYDQKLGSWVYGSLEKTINEHINFERGLDPKEAMGTGNFRPIKAGDKFAVKDIFNYAKQGKDKLYSAEALDEETATGYVDRFVNFDMDIKPSDVYGKDSTGTWYASFNKIQKCWIIGHDGN